MMLMHFSGGTDTGSPRRHALHLGEPPRTRSPRASAERPSVHNKLESTRLAKLCAKRVVTSGECSLSEDYRSRARIAS